MIQILMKQDFFLAWSVHSVIGIGDFWQNEPNQYFGDSEIHGLLNNKDGEID